MKTPDKQTNTAKALCYRFQVATLKAASLPDETLASLLTQMGPNPLPALSTDDFPVSELAKIIAEWAASEDNPAVWLVSQAFINRELSRYKISKPVMLDMLGSFRSWYLPLKPMLDKLASITALRHRIKD